MLDRLKMMGCEVYRTDLNGEIKIILNKKQNKINTTCFKGEEKLDFSRKTRYNAFVTK